MEEENSEEVCGKKKVPIRVTSVGSADGDNRGLSDGRRKCSRRENYWHCIFDKHSGLQHNSHVR